jgi:hypothetical protein
LSVTAQTCPTRGDEGKAAITNDAEPLQPNAGEKAPALKEPDRKPTFAGRDQGIRTCRAAIARQGVIDQPFAERDVLHRKRPAGRTPDCLGQLAQRIGMEPRHGPI